MGRRSLSHGPLFCTAYSYGYQHVLDAALKPRSTRPYAGKDHAVHADCLYILNDVVPSRFGVVLALQQPAVVCTAVRCDSAD